MFDIGAAELLVIVVVAIIVIGPKEMPRAMRTVGRYIGKMRRMSSHFRSGLDAMIREAELEDSEREWRERNAKIMARTDAADVPPAMEPLSADTRPALADPELQEAEARAEAAVARTKASDAPEPSAAPDAAPSEGEPQLPLDPATEPVIPATDKPNGGAQ